MAISKPESTAAIKSIALNMKYSDHVDFFNVNVWFTSEIYCNWFDSIPNLEIFNYCRKILCDIRLEKVCRRIGEFQRGDLRENSGSS